MSSVLVVGSVAFDSIKTPSGQVQRCLGGSATYFSLAASFFADVRLVAVVGSDFTAEHETVMTKHGVRTEGIQRAEGKTFHWSGEYGENLNEAGPEHRHEQAPDPRWAKLSELRLD